MMPGSYGHPVARFVVAIEHNEGDAPTVDEVLEAIMGVKEGVAKAMVIEVKPDECCQAEYESGQCPHREED